MALLSSADTHLVVHANPPSQSAVERFASCRTHARRRSSQSMYLVRSVGRRTCSDADGVPAASNAVALLFALVSADKAGRDQVVESCTRSTSTRNLEAIEDRENCSGDHAEP